MRGPKLVRQIGNKYGWKLSQAANLTPQYDFLSGEVKKGTLYVVGGNAMKVFCPSLLTSTFSCVSGVSVVVPLLREIIEVR